MPEGTDWADHLGYSRATGELIYNGREVFKDVTVYAIVSGTVVEPSQGSRFDFVILGTDGRFYVYEHIVPIEGLTSVTAGDEVGRLAEAGDEDDRAGVHSHVHIEIRTNSEQESSINPRPVLVGLLEGHKEKLDALAGLPRCGP